VAAEISLLTPDFRKQLIKTLAACRERGVKIEVYSTLITPVEQGQLWKQGRSRTDAELKVMALENANAPYLADCLRRAVPLETNYATDLLPGMSWQQWGEAATVLWVDFANKLNWSPKWTQSGVNGYRVFAEECKNFSLHSGSEFMPDYDAAWRFVQLRPEPFPSDKYDIVEIDAEMKRRFSR
jgi:peptidoglycan LD-endopeptidase CwlK